jgi:hypothetical protein
MCPLSADPTSCIIGQNLIKQTHLSVQKECIKTNVLNSPDEPGSISKTTYSSNLLDAPIPDGVDVIE